MAGQKLYSQYRQWRSDCSIKNKGIIVGSDLTQEWLLPWWWEHYSRFNSYPVTFVDFGLSENMRTWCQERGELIRLLVADVFVIPKEEISPSLAKEMENTYGKEFWTCRNAWFKKPLACLQSPYLMSLWIDLDCQICGPLQTIFDLCQSSDGLVMAKEEDPLWENYGYNSGVIAFKRDLSLIEDWADQVFEYNHIYRSDQDILTKILIENQFSVTELPSIYNWSRAREENPDVIIIHWHGYHGKTAIAHQMMQKNLQALDGTKN